MDAVQFGLDGPEVGHDRVERRPELLERTVHPVEARAGWETMGSLAAGQSNRLVSHTAYS